MVSVILLTFNLFLFQADVNWLPETFLSHICHIYVDLVRVAPLAPMIFPGSQFSNFTFNIFIALIFFLSKSPNKEYK